MDTKAFTPGHTAAETEPVYIILWVIYSLNTDRFVVKRLFKIVQSYFCKGHVCRTVGTTTTLAVFSSYVVVLHIHTV